MTAKIRELNLDDLKTVAGGVTIVASATVVRPTATVPLATSMVRPIASLSVSSAIAPQLALR